MINCLEFFDKETDNIEGTLPGDLLIMCDNDSAVQMAKSEEIRPKSRHYALRLFNLREEHRRVWYCRTELMCADALTKAVQGKQRALLLGLNCCLPG